jgi:hypothetical protein
MVFPLLVAFRRMHTLNFGFFFDFSLRSGECTRQTMAFSLVSRCARSSLSQPLLQRGPRTLLLCARGCVSDILLVGAGFPEFEDRRVPEWASGNGPRGATDHLGVRADIFFRTSFMELGLATIEADSARGMQMVILPDCCVGSRHRHRRSGEDRVNDDARPPASRVDDRGHADALKHEFKPDD